MRAARWTGPVADRSKSDQYKYEKLRAEIKADPGMWIRVSTCKSFESARANASLMRRRAAWQGYELRADRGVVSARWIGEAEVAR